MVSAQAVIRPGILDAEARAAYAPAFATRCDTTGGLGTLESALDKAELFDVIAGGVTVARYALQSAHRAGGCEVFIVAAVGALAGVGLVESIAPYIERQCAGADRLTINTRRHGLVKKLTRQGWTLDSFVMRKKIK